MYSHKQSIEQKYYVRVEYALKKSYHYQRPCLSPLFKTGKNLNSCFSLVCLFVCLLLLFLLLFFLLPSPYLFGLFTPLPFPIPQFYHATALSLFMLYIIKYTSNFIRCYHLHSLFKEHVCSLCKKYRVGFLFIATN